MTKPVFPYDSEIRPLNSPSNEAVIFFSSKLNAWLEHLEQGLNRNIGRLTFPEELLPRTQIEWLSAQKRFIIDGLHAKLESIHIPLDLRKADENIDVDSPMGAQRYKVGVRDPKTFVEELIATPREPRLFFEYCEILVQTAEKISTARKKIQAYDEHGKDYQKELSTLEAVPAESCDETQRTRIHALKELIIDIDGKTAEKRAVLERHQQLLTDITAKYKSGSLLDPLPSHEQHGEALFFTSVAELRKILEHEKQVTLVFDDNSKPNRSRFYQFSVSPFALGILALATLTVGGLYLWWQRSIERDETRIGFHFPDTSDSVSVDPQDYLQIPFVSYYLSTEQKEKIARQSGGPEVVARAGEELKQLDLRRLKKDLENWMNSEAAIDYQVSPPRVSIMVNMDLSNRILQRFGPSTRRGVEVSFRSRKSIIRGISGFDGPQATDLSYFCEGALARVLTEIPLPNGARIEVASFWVNLTTLTNELNKKGLCK